MTLTNVDNTIQGAGIIGNNGLTLINQATINANSSGQTLILQNMSGLTNTGLLEATNGGNLQSTESRSTTAEATSPPTAAARCNCLAYAIQGGTLNNNGGTLGTAAGNTAFLDGSTGAGAVTINGTYTSDFGSDTFVLGTITNNSNFQLNGGGGTNTFLLLDANTTLQGGGTVTLSTACGGGTAFIEQASGGLTLTNVDNTIQGAGIIGNNGLTLVNQAGGTILANNPGNTLIINGGGLTNNGTFQANSGSSLIVCNSNDDEFISPTTLTGGTYNVYSGTMQLPGNINTNAATILLDGASAIINNGAAPTLWPTSPPTRQRATSPFRTA